MDLGDLKRLPEANWAELIAALNHSDFQDFLLARIEDGGSREEGLENLAAYLSALWNPYLPSCPRRHNRGLGGSQTHPRLSCLLMYLPRAPARRTGRTLDFGILSSSPRRRGGGEARKTHVRLPQVP